MKKNKIYYVIKVLLNGKLAAAVAQAQTGRCNTYFIFKSIHGDKTINLFDIITN